MKKISALSAKAAAIMSAVAATTITAFAADSDKSVYTAAPDFSVVSTPIVGLINAIINPALAVVGALGTLFCIVLGVKFAQAEEPQEREKAKSHLKNAIVGFVLIFVLMMALKLLMPIMQEWVAGQVNASAAS